jgi:CDP-diacylglycerol---glycerol-3-phosphate 3-phosphatidyltransferase
MDRKNQFFQNLANIVTILGIFSAIALALVLSLYPSALWLAVILAAATVFTDLYDGHLARKFNIKSELGAVLDRIRDKIFICSALILLAWRKQLIPTDLSQTSMICAKAMILLILLFEILLLISGVIGIAKKMDIKAGQFGKWKMISEFIVVMAWIFFLAIGKMFALGVFQFFIWPINALMALTIFFAYKSLEGYAKRYF